MTHFILRDLEDDVKSRLKRRAERHGRSMEEEARHILCNALKDENRPVSKLASRIAARFAKAGLTADLPELRGHFGHSRPWFRCPACARRVAVLYHRSGRFACRVCNRIGYLSQSDDDIDRAWRRQRKVESKLIDGLGRPKGMNGRTYERLVSIVDECERVKDAALIRRLLHLTVEL